MPDNPVIYIADHDANALVAYEAVLEGEGFELFFFETGHAILEATRKQPPNLLIFDLMLPDLNGWEFCESIRQDAKLKHLPIMLTTVSMTVVLTRPGAMPNANVIMPKPFNRKVFIAQIHALIHPTTEG